MRRYYCDRCGTEVCSEREFLTMRLKKCPAEFGTVYDLCAKCWNDFTEWMEQAGKEKDKRQ